MNDNKCVEFLQWALPRIHMRWPGFKKVRRQVCRKVAERIQELDLSVPSQYRAYLEEHPEEWKKLDSFCRITISRFYRDPYMFRFLQDHVLRDLTAATATDRLRFWCCGSASGEEPYTLSLIWNHYLKPDVPDRQIEVIATDSEDGMIKRALRGRYSKSSVKELPEELLSAGFTQEDEMFILKERFRGPVRFLKQDVRQEMPDGPFHLILCRYLAFTYFDQELQEVLLDKMIARLVPGGALILGSIDRLPRYPDNLTVWSKRNNIYRKTG